MIDGKGLSEADFYKLMHWALSDAQAQVKRQKEEIKRLQEIICCAGRYLTDEVYEIPYCVTEEFMRIREK